ncbi:MAG: heparinase II/III family protein [Rhodospirillales bacterium]|nr:heparinase II/III family protein [Rhodospirillales bacterium]
MSGTISRWWRQGRQQLARVPLSMARVPDAPSQTLRDPWPGNAARGASILRGQLEIAGGKIGLWPEGFLAHANAPGGGLPLLRAAAHGFAWLRDLRALGTDAARVRARDLVDAWLDAPADGEVGLAEVAGNRLAAWLSHYDFFAATAADAFRQRLMVRLVADARALAAALPTEEMDARAIAALKGVIAAGAALPDHGSLLVRALRVLGQELARQILPDGSHAERSPAQMLAVLADLVEIRQHLATAHIEAPPFLAGAIERLSGALRVLRHGDGGMAIFNATREDGPRPIELVLAQAGRAVRPASVLPDAGFYRLAAGRSLIVVDGGAPAPPRLDRLAHAGTLSFEFSVGRERLIVNCGTALAATQEWRQGLRYTAAHSTLVIADTSSSEVREEGLGRRPVNVEARHEESMGAHWLHLSHDGWKRVFGAVHVRRFYLAESGEDLRGEDTVEADTPQPFVIRFHLHPSVDASLQQDGEAVLLRLPSGSGWRLRADGARISLEPSVYLAAPEPRRCEQVVLTGYVDGPQQVRWAITKVA